MESVRPLAVLREYWYEVLPIELDAEFLEPVYVEVGGRHA